ncbi:MAG: HAD-IA family hydrolase [Anaerolineae bacterium]|nr:HAD-IA family hydrolase [Anaerolineae bacterium]
MLKAVVFDFDGLVIETEAPIMLAWQELYREYGFELTVEMWLPIIGSFYSDDTFNPHDDLAARLGYRLDYDALEQRTIQRSLEILAAEPILPGVTQWIADAEARGIKLAVASSSPREWVEGHLERLGLREHFATVKTANDVPKIKPDPALYTAAVEALGAAPNEAVALEDSMHGIQAARRAGLYAIAVPTPLTRGMDFSAAHVVAESLAAFTLEDWLAHLDGQGGAG